MDWNGWPLERVLVVFVAIVFLVIFVQVTLFHYRQNFRHWSMWIPVIATPIFSILLLVFCFFQSNWYTGLLTTVLGIGIVAGLYGSYVHIKGVGNRVDGYKLRNFLVGPPLALPALITAMSILGLFALHWG